MSELSYKELQEKGIFDVPYRAFEYMQTQQAEIDALQNDLIKAAEGQMKLFEHNNELQNLIDELKAWCINGVECGMLSTTYNQALIDMLKILKGGVMK